MSCATEIHKPILYRAAWAPFHHPFSAFQRLRFTGCPCVWWRRGQIGACRVPSSSFSSTSFCLQQGGRRRTGRHQSCRLCHIFFPPTKKEVLASFGAQPTASGLSPTPGKGSSTFPCALGVLSGRCHEPSKRASLRVSTADPGKTPSPLQT